MIEAIEADLKDFKIANDYDTIVSIGLLMFFRESRAHGYSARLKTMSAPVAVLL
jgi:cyclopropane fatty-acyl-phospholipid synthase-like methyltransferase